LVIQAGTLRHSIAVLRPDAQTHIDRPGSQHDSIKLDQGFALYQLHLFGEEKHLHLSCEMLLLCFHVFPASFLRFLLFIFAPSTESCPTTTQVEEALRVQASVRQNRQRKLFNKGKAKLCKTVQSYAKLCKAMQSYAKLRGVRLQLCLVGVPCRCLQLHNVPAGLQVLQVSDLQPFPRTRNKMQQAVVCLSVLVLLEKKRGGFAKELKAASQCSGSGCIRFENL